MNTTFLSAFPATPPQEHPVAARPAKTRGQAVEAQEPIEEKPSASSELTGDSDKADSFAEMLAAMIAVATPVNEAHVETVESAAVGSVTSSATDVPRDGAGSPLFSMNITATPAADTLTAAVSTIPTDASATQNPAAAMLAGTAGQSHQSGLELNDAAAAELASLQVEAASPEVETPTPVGEVKPSTLAVEDFSMVDTGPVLEEPAEANLPVAEIREIQPDATSVESTSIETPEASSAREGVTAQTPLTTARQSATDVSRDEAVNIEVERAQPASRPVISETPPQSNSEPVVSSETSAEGALAAEQPFEEPPEPQVDRPESDSPKRTSSRRPLNSLPAAAEPSWATTQSPEIQSVVPVESALEIQAVDSRDREVAPVTPAKAPATAAMDVETLLSTGAAVNEAPGGQTGFSVAGTHADAASAAAPAHVSQQVQQALAAYEAGLPQGGNRSFEMLLDPPELGRLLVQMSRTSKGLDVRIAAENEGVRSILEATGGELQQSLQLSGFDLGQFGGSGSDGTFANGDEWVAAPSLQSFAKPGAVGNHATPVQRPRNSAVDVMV